jgi:hypothetical protein
MAEGRSAAEVLDELALYPDRAGLQVDVTGTQRGQLGPSQAWNVPRSTSAPANGTARTGAGIWRVHMISASSGD